LDLGEAGWAQEEEGEEVEEEVGSCKWLLLRWWLRR
jgi:hypothetical protein